MAAAGNHIYVKELTPDQIVRLKAILDAQAWDIKVPPYTHWQARRDKTIVTAYQSGKLTVQGQGLEDFVLFILEPEILHEASFGYDDPTPVADPLADFTAHAGIDESGKGDYFGPLVVAAVFVTPDNAQRLLDLGVKDSKAIKSDNKIRQIAEKIPFIVDHKFAIVAIGPEAYNRLYAQIGNVNRMLAWGHARALENLLEKAPECRDVLADKFGDDRLIQIALLKKGREITLSQRTKAESDIAVAAASIMARNGFVSGMEKLGRELDMTIPKGANPAVIDAARQIVARHGETALPRFVKMHFQTTSKVLAPEGPGME